MYIYIYYGYSLYIWSVIVHSLSWILYYDFIRIVILRAVSFDASDKIVRDSNKSRFLRSSYLLFYNGIIDRAPIYNIIRGLKAAIYVKGCLCTRTSVYSQSCIVHVLRLRGMFVVREVNGCLLEQISVWPTHMCEQTYVTMIRV